MNFEIHLKAMQKDREKLHKHRFGLSMKQVNTIRDKIAEKYGPLADELGLQIKKPRSYITDGGNLIVCMVYSTSHTNTIVVELTHQITNNFTNVAIEAGSKVLPVLVKIDRPLRWREKIEDYMRANFLHYLVDYKT